MPTTCKVYKFVRKDKNRYRKVYSYIRKKPKYEYCIDTPFTLIVGKAAFTNTSGPVTVTYTDFDPTVSFSNVPVVTSLSVDSFGNGQADVNVFVTSISTVSVSFESSAPFTGDVHFHIITQD